MFVFILVSKYFYDNFILQIHTLTFAGYLYRSHHSRCREKLWAIVQDVE